MRRPSVLQKYTRGQAKSSRQTWHISYTTYSISLSQHEMYLVFINAVILEKNPFIYQCSSGSRFG